MLTALGRIPNVSEHFIWEGSRFEVVDMDGQRVDRVLVSREPGDPLPLSHQPDRSG